MSIIASSPVPAGHRLIDAPTLGIVRPAVCPPWCNQDHAGEATELDGFSIGSVHERIVAELPAQDPAWLNRPATAVVMVESSTEAGEVVAPARVVLAIAEGPEGAHPGEQDCQGWTGTPEQAEQLADALMVAAEMIRVLRRGAR